MSTTILLNVLLERARRLQLAKAFVVQQAANSGGVLKEHGGDVSMMKLPCLFIVFFFALQRQCLTRFLSPRILYHKRFIVEDHGCISIVIENNTMWASGTRIELDQG